MHIHTYTHRATLAFLSHPTAPGDPKESLISRNVSSVGAIGLYASTVPSAKAYTAIRLNIRTVGIVCSGWGGGGGRGRQDEVRGEFVEDAPASEANLSVLAPLWRATISCPSACAQKSR